MMQPKTKYKIHLAKNVLHLAKNVSLLGLGGEMVKVYQILYNLK